jgi:hypothetical protein
MGYTGMYITIMIYNCIAGFRGAHRDATLKDAVEPPRPLGSEPDQQRHDDMDPDPCSEDEECFYSPDAESMEEAVSKFMEGMEGQESSGFQNINRLIHSLPVPEQKANRCMMHADAV